MADVARATVGAGVGASVDHDPGADAGVHLDQAHRDGLGIAHGVLAQGRGVRVVGGQHRHPRQPGLQVLGHRIGVPPGHDRRLARPTRPAGRSGRAGSSRRRTGRGGPSPLRSSSDPIAAAIWSRTSEGPCSTGASIWSSASTAPPRSVTAILVCVVSTAADQHAGLRGVEHQAAAPPPAGRLGGVALDDHPGAQQCVETLRDRHARQAGDLQDVASGGGATVPDQAQHVTGTGGHAPSSTVDPDPRRVRESVTTRHLMLDRLAT